MDEEALGETLAGLERMHAIHAQTHLVEVEAMVDRIGNASEGAHDERRFAAAAAAGAAVSVPEAYKLVGSGHGGVAARMVKSRRGHGAAHPGGALWVFRVECLELLLGCVVGGGFVGLGVGGALLGGGGLAVLGELHCNCLVEDVVLVEVDAAEVEQGVGVGPAPFEGFRELRGRRRRVGGGSSIRSGARQRRHGGLILI